MVTAMLWLPAILDGLMTMAASYTSLPPEAYRCNIPVSWNWENCLLTPLQGCDDTDNFNFSAFPVDHLFPNKSSGKPDFCKYFR